MQIARLRFRRRAEGFHGTNSTAAVNAAAADQELVVTKLEMAGSDRLSHLDRARGSVCGLHYFFCFQHSEIVRRLQNRGLARQEQPTRSCRARNSDSGRNVYLGEIECERTVG
jgi:hypothetical protein